ncbi:MAG: hypothetical protein ABI844_03110 [Saprospiraceae bacterium]
MKYLMMIVCLVSISGFAVSQSCHSKATAGGMGCCAMKASMAMTAADKEGIQVRKDVSTGELAFYKTSSCHYSGTTSYVQVDFNAQEGMFVNKAPQTNEMEMVPVSMHSTEMKKMDCSKMSKAECAEKMAKGECHMKAKT